MSSKLEHSHLFNTEASTAVALSLQGWTRTMAGSRWLAHELSRRDGQGGQDGCDEDLL